jgi:type II secretory pathway pseudopilin PulG
MNMKRQDSGFTLIEVAFVALVTVVIGSIAVIQLRATRAVFDAQAVSNVVASQMNYARQVAIDQRRNVLIQFLGTNEIKVSRLEPDGGSTLLSNVFLATGFQYGLPSGTPPDTPEDFGNESAVSFGTGSGGTFLGDGTLVDSTGVVLNGTVFTIGGGDSTARAVTLTGATGRVLQYIYAEGEWIQPQ